MAFKKKKESTSTQKTTNTTTEEPVKKASYLTLYRYATAWDKILIFLGTLFATANGAGLPLMTIAFGDIMNAFITFDGSDASKETLEKSAKEGVLFFTLIGVGTFIASYGQICFWMIAGENQAKRIRMK
jgi:ATP-binding cassette subfamily B (MDR/TAP) protein 1